MVPHRYPFLGNFIYQNYQQALERIEIDTTRLATLSTKLGVSGDDYEHYLELERAYLAGLQAEPENVKATADYMEQLFELENLKYDSFEIFKQHLLITHFSRQKSDAATAQYKQRDFLMTNRGYTGKQITRIDTQFRTTFDRWKAKNEEVLRYEEEHNIALRWAPTSQEYIDALTVVRERKYRRAIDDLERLVVQRLFEMTKLGMSGVGMCDEPLLFLKSLFLSTTGYKQRENISKSLKACVDAIQSALKRYNDAAAQLNPPRPPLTWETVMNAVTVADFDLLRDTRQDI